MPHAFLPHVRITAHLANTSADTSVIYLGGRAAHGLISAPGPDEVGRFALVVGDTQIVMHGRGPGGAVVVVLAPGDTASVDLLSDNRSFLPPPPPPPPPGTNLYTYETPFVGPSAPIDSAEVAGRFLSALHDGELQYLPNPHGELSYEAFGRLGLPFWCRTTSSGWLVRDTLRLTRSDSLMIKAADNLGHVRLITSQL